MNPDLKSFLDAIAAMRNQANETLAKLPPLEQAEASQELVYVFRSLRHQANELIEFASNLAAKLPELATKIAGSAMAEMITKGDAIAKADHAAALVAAANSRETEVRAAFTAEQAKLQLVSDRRKQLIDTKVLPAIAAEKMPVELLTVDSFLANGELVKARLAKLEPFGMTAEKTPLVIADVAALGFDADGIKVYDHRVALCTEAAGAQKGGARGGNPLAGPGNSAAGAAATAETAGGVRRNLL